MKLGVEFPDFVVVAEGHRIDDIAEYVGIQSGAFDIKQGGQVIGDAEMIALHQINRSSPKQSVLYVAKIGGILTGEVGVYVEFFDEFIELQTPIQRQALLSPSI